MLRQLPVKLAEATWAERRKPARATVVEKMFESMVPAGGVERKKVEENNRCQMMKIK